MKINRSFMSWSGGKDCMQALHQFIQNNGDRPGGLLTAYSLAHNRVTMHGVPMEIIEKQSEALDIPLYTLGLPENVTDELYEELLLNKYSELKEQGFTEAVFGDIFLEDLRDYRIRQLEKVGLNYQFPIWGNNTKTLIDKFISLGYRSLVVSINGAVLDKAFAGKTIDDGFVSSLPMEVDPCGENGEFHTFVYDGPLFETPVLFKTGETVKRSYPIPSSEESYTYWFTDLKPAR